MTYAQQLAQLTSSALDQGVPQAEIIQALELVKLEVAFQLIATTRLALAEDNEPKIKLP